MNITGYKVYDEQGKFTRIITKRQELEEIGNNDWLKAVSCFIVNKNGNILLEKRVNKGINPGQLDLCSGHLNGDEVYTQAMVRELREELGIEQQESMNIIPIKEIYATLEENKIKRNFFVQFYCLLRNKDDIDFQEEEIEDIIQLPMQEVFELIRQGKTRFPYDERFEEIFAKVEELYNERYGKSTNNIEKTVEGK